MTLVDINACYLIAQVGIGVATASTLVQGIKELFAEMLGNTQKNIELAVLKLDIDCLDRYALLQKNCGGDTYKISVLSTLSASLSERASKRQYSSFDPKSLQMRNVARRADTFVVLCGVALFFFLVIAPFFTKEMAKCDEVNSTCTLVNGWWLVLCAIFAASPFVYLIYMTLSCKVQVFVAIVKVKLRHTITESRVRELFKSLE
jgi:hypothetical protein